MLFGMLAAAMPISADDTADEKPKGRTFYVSPDGNDMLHGLTRNRPLKTPQVAADKAQPGDTIVFLGGTWEFRDKMLLNIKTSGEEGAYITFKAAEGEKPIFKVGGYGVWNAISINASYIIIDGLTLVGINDELTVAEGEEAYNNVIKNQDTGASYDNAFNARVNTNGISFDGRNHVENGGVPYNHIIIRNCDVSMFPACGIGGGACDYVTIENNHVYNNMWFSLYGSSGISLLGTTDMDDNYGTKIIIRNNVVHDNYCQVMCQNGRKWSDGNGIIIDYNKNNAEGTKRLPYKGTTLIENNLVYRNGGGGIHLFNSSNINVVNNTCYDNGVTPQLNHWGNISVSWCSNVRVVNNIAVATREGASSISYTEKNSSNVIVANNIHYNTINPDNSASLNGKEQLPDDPELNQGNIWADPLLVDPKNGDFHLKENSPAIDVGTKTLAPAIDVDGSKRPQGATYDMGAYESTYTSKNPGTGAELELKDAVNYETAVAAKGTPTIDGEIDYIWQHTQSFNVNNYIKGNGAHGTVRTMWDENYLYVLADIKDSNLSAKSKLYASQDSVEFFVDQRDDKTNSYMSDDAHYRVNINNVRSLGTNGKGENLISAVKHTSDGYIVEAAIKINVNPPKSGVSVGFDVQINDDDGSGKCVSIAKWSDETTSTNKDTTRFGSIDYVDSYMHMESADETIMKVSLNGKQLQFDANPFIYEGYPMIPLETVYKELGDTVTYDEANYTYTCSNGENVVVITVGSKTANINGKTIALDIAPVIKGETAYIPSSFLTKSHAANEEWDYSKSMVVLTFDASKLPVEISDAQTVEPDEVTGPPETLPADTTRAPETTTPFVTKPPETTKEPDTTNPDSESTDSTDTEPAGNETSGGFPIVPVVIVVVVIVAVGAIIAIIGKKKK